MENKVYTLLDDSHQMVVISGHGALLMFLSFSFSLNFLRFNIKQEQLISDNLSIAQKPEGGENTWCAKDEVFYGIFIPSDRHSHSARVR